MIEATKSSVLGEVRKQENRQKCGKEEEEEDS